MTSKISVIIPCLNSAARLMPLLAGLVEGTANGLIKQVIFADGGSSDITAEIAEEVGADFISTPKGRGRQCKIAVIYAKAEWLLFLHDDCQLAPLWDDELIEFINDAENQNKCAYFRFKLDDKGIKAKLVAWGVYWRCIIFGFPYGDQGLLISRALYEKIGGFSSLPIMEDVDIISRIKVEIGKQNLVMLDSVLTTSADKYKAGYLKRIMRNFRYLMSYKMGKDPQKIAESYYK